MWLAANTTKLGSGVSSIPIKWTSEIRYLRKRLNCNHVVFHSKGSKMYLSIFRLVKKHQQQEQQKHKQTKNKSQWERGK